ncbi:hypothetical protein BJ875DRAFT_502824 [Amylocarpus encephaloides]|uniref:HCP-like protein n=1 Tax=Amylocarpus encephaloides TaxID=45428 RepID=A0A9P7YPC2_9HELO|nr:hypothetical protein BJ875DRAFT_502824 [Amylocarpus encephaloides]
MPLRDLLKKKDKIAQHAPPPVVGKPAPLAPPEFTIMRSDTNTQEIISPPSFSSGSSSREPSTTDGQAESRGSKLWRRSRSASNASAVSTSSRGSDKDKRKSKSSPKRLSQRLHFRKSEVGSASVPDHLPEIDLGNEAENSEGAQSQWEKRATILAKQNGTSMARPTAPSGAPPDAAFSKISLDGKSPQLTRQADDNIQEAIRLHEAGDLNRSTKMFGRLADPDGENNALSQVLYGLALRHGWGCTPDPTQAVKYLSAAASNAASIEELALQAGMKKGGSAKGELVLAIFELANCFRHGWGVPVDKIAAKQYYETAANLGDTDAMNEVGWCYVEGFGCRKDKWAAAKYYRLAEQAGSKTLGNSWIWKDKYSTPKK